MFKYFGKEYCGDDIIKLVGSMEQIAGIKNYEFSEGKAKNVSASDVKTGGGLTYTVATGRGMDILFAEYKGIALCHFTETGVVNPAFFEEHNDEWMRSFSAGMLTTCGLNQVGNDCIHNNIHYPLHGRIGNLPAQNISTEEYFDEKGNYILQISGTVKQVKPLEEALVLKRQIKSIGGENSIYITDCFENRRFNPSPFMLLYHFNLGFPFLSENTKIYTKYSKISSMYKATDAQINNALCATPIAKNHNEEVYFLELIPDKEGLCNVLCVNDCKTAEMGILLTFRHSILPRLAVWKQLAYGDYVMGIEPTNSYVQGVAYEAQNNTLKYLEGREKKKSEIAFTLLEGYELLKTMDRYK